MLRLTIVSLIPWLILGCLSAEPRFDPQASSESAVSDAGFDGTWEAAKDVIRERGFIIDETDTRRGRITTQPVTSQYFFEFWRKDVATARDYWQATWMPIRRQAVVEIIQAPDDARCRVTVSVMKQRFSTPERQVTNSADASHFLSASLPSVESGREVGRKADAWIDMGRDPAMEASLREAIMRRVAFDEPPINESSSDAG